MFVTNPYSFGAGSPAPTNLYHVLLYGQSLSLGVDPDGASVISGSLSGHRMFNTGVRVHYDETGLPIANVNSPVKAASLASLSALTEHVNASDGDYGETLASGIALRMTDAGLFSATGRSAYPISMLDKFANGGFGDFNHYQNTYAAALHGKLESDALGFVYRLGPMVWKQGEADGAASTSKATYKTKLTDLYNDFKADLAMAALVNTADFKMITDQISIGWNSTTYQDIAVAVLELHRANMGVVCLGPGYVYEYTAVNDVHLTSNGYRNVGERFGLAVETINRGGTWHPCHITSVSRSANTITVNVHVPSPPLVKDTTLVSSIANDGFVYTGANITSVSISDDGTGDNNGVITISIDASAAGNLRYAYHNNAVDQRNGPVSGPRGNIRDSASAVSLNDGSHLYNWLCIDDWAVA